MKEKSTVAIVGAGPIGIELAIALKKTGIPYLLFDREQVAQMIYNFPPQTHFFSSNERIGISGYPVQTTDQQKCSREDYLAYIRTLVMHYQLEVHSYEEVATIKRVENGEFLLHTLSAKGEREYQVKYVVLATGGTSTPRKLNVPGENLPHVSHKMEDPHKYFLKHVLIIGGKNSAGESALRCYHAGAKVSLCTRKKQFDPKDIKYWLFPELVGRIEHREIDCYFESEVKEILPDRVHLNNGVEIFADFVIKAIGFDANMELFKQLGIEMTTEQQMVKHDETMQTSVPNVYVLGTVVGGTQIRYRIFIENTHEHVAKILDALCAKLSISKKPDIPYLKSRENQLEE